MLNITFELILCFLILDFRPIALLFEDLFSSKVRLEPATYLEFTCPDQGYSDQGVTFCQNSNPG